LRFLRHRLCIGFLGEEFLHNIRKTERMNDRAIQESSAGKLIVPIDVSSVYRNFVPLNSMAVAATRLRVAFVGFEPAC